jgi:predicted XRE-type DNA-binding protein
VYKYIYGLLQQYFKKSSPYLRKYVKDNELTQEKTAAVFGIAQSRVSDLMRSKWEKFSLEMRISLEFRAGRKVQLKLVA